MNANRAIPWVTLGAIEWLERNIGEGTSTFEWGSGGSTLYFSERVTSHVAVEHAASLYSVVSDRLEERSVYNCEYLYIEAIPLNEMRYRCRKLSGTCSGCICPGVTFASDRGSKAWRCYRDYVTVIERFTSMFDIVFVDGRARNACIYHAIDKVRPGGVIVLDNSRRKRYGAGNRLLARWPRIDFCGKGPDLNTKHKYEDVEWCTTVWTKPLLALPFAMSGGQYR